MQRRPETAWERGLRYVALFSRFFYSIPFLLPHPVCFSKSTKIEILLLLLRQAKEMKRLSQQRKETDIEYEDKKTTMSLTQAELDRENDYYMRPASPLR